MLKKIQEFFQSLLKTGKSGITKTDQAAETIEDLAEVYGKYDPTTPPGQFKEQKPIIDQEGNIKTRVASYTPESFTETQKRTGVGSFSDDALRERYFDEGFDDTMALEEFIIRERGITPDVRATELREKGRIKPLKEDDSTPSLMTAADDVTKLSEEKISFITNIAKTTGKDPKDVRQMIVNKMNEGYLPRDPKRVDIDDDARIEAYIETQRQMDDTGFVADIIEEAAELPTMGITGNPTLDKMLLSEQKLVREGTEAAQAKIDEAQEKGIEIMEMLKELNINTGSINAEIFKIDIPSNFAPGVRALEKEIKKLEELFGRTIPAAKSTDPENFTKVLESINKQASADQALAEQLMEDIVMRAQARQITREEGMAELQKVKEKFDKIPEAREEGLKTGVYTSPFGTEGRTLNAKGGRIGFDEGGGPKMGRRGFLQLMGAGLASLFVPKGAQRVAEIATAGATKVPLTAEGMPIWFPSLVDKIRKEGKLRKATYADAKAGEPIDVYTFEDPSLSGKKLFMEENIQTGAITISGRGDDMQIAELTFRPGEESIMLSPKDRTRKVSKAPNEFTAEEFMKGPGEGIGDFENFGGMEDLRFGLDTWENLVKSPKQKLEEIAEKFKTTQKNPTPDVDVDEFAKGGRVGYKSGSGVETLFRRKAS